MNIIDDKIKHTFDFYMLVNNLKYIIRDNNQSIADEIYGAMILATAINSEYEKVDNLGLTIRMILLGITDEFYQNKLIDVLNKMNNGDRYIKAIRNYYDSSSSDNNSKFAFNCATIELSMSYFLKKF